MASPPKKPVVAPKLPQDLAKSADFPEEEVHARARATARGLFRKNLKLAKREP